MDAAGLLVPLHAQPKQRPGIRSAPGRLLGQATICAERLWTSRWRRTTSVPGHAEVGKVRADLHGECAVRVLWVWWWDEAW